LFFFLQRQYDSLTWRSVSESAISELQLFSWPLPLNLFRHRLAQISRRFGLHPEIIDGLLGHAEAHSATHGDHSVRIWQEDMEAARPILDAAFESLGFLMLPSWSTEPPCLPQCGPEPPDIERIFGEAAREQHRREVRIALYRAAERTIKTFLGKRSLVDLTAEETYELSKKLLLNEKGLPTSRGQVKYNYLQLKIAQIERVRNKRVRQRRRFMPMAEERSPFCPSAVGVRAILANATDLARQLEHPSHLRTRLAIGLATAVLAALHCRLADKTVLCALAVGKNVRRVAIGHELYLELGTFSSPLDPDTPIKRVPLPRELLALACHPIGDPLNDDLLDKPLPGSFVELAASLSQGMTAPATPRQLIDVLSGLVDQRNVLELPGVLAGILAGRISTFSPNWSDEYLLRHGCRPVLPRPEQASDPVGLPLAKHALRRVDRKDDLEPTDDEVDRSLGKPSGVRELFRQLRLILNGKPPDSDTSGASSQFKKRALTRTQKADAAFRLVRTYRNKLGSASLLLVEWVVDMLGTKEKTLRTASIKRYLDALIPAFIDVGYDADLVSMDEEEITDLYIDLMDSLKVKDKRYAANRLVAFHRWAQQSEYALPAPDWSSIPEAPSHEGVLPGMVAEDEYQSTLRLIWSSDAEDSLKHAAGLLLIGGYRFGLRKFEAGGLHREDWVQWGDRHIVLVRTNHDRRLKWPGSRRQVPQLVPLSELEEKILKEIFVTAEAQHADRFNVALLATGYPLEAQVNKAAALASLVLKQVTGNQSISLHHLRHSFANRMALALFGFDSRNEKVLGWSNDERSAIRSTVLGRIDGRRRTAWALGRLLGHMGPSTTFRNYTHLMFGWAMHYATPPVRIQNAPAGFLEIDAFPRHAAPYTELLQKSCPVAEPLRFADAIRFLRLIAREQPADVAANNLGLDLVATTALYDAAKTIGARMELSPTKTDDRSNPTPFDFLRRLSDGAWARLLALEPQASRLPANALSLLVQVVGATRQLLIWKKGHATFVGSLIQLLSIADERYRVIASSSLNDELLSATRAVGFKPVAIKDVLEERQELLRDKYARRNLIVMSQAAKKAVTRKKKGSGRANSLQLDVVHIGSHDWPDRPRCALLLGKDHSAILRNSIEVVVAALAVSAVRQTLSGINRLTSGKS